MVGGTRRGPSAGALIADRYRLVRPLGSGAFAKVWLADDLGNADLPVAIKIFQPQKRSHDPSYLMRFRQEAAILERLKHPTIARSLGYLSVDDLSAIVIEYVEGRPLRAELVRRALADEPFTFEEIGRAMDALLAALEAAHAEGVIHRDLKPANIIVRSMSGNSSWALTVLDFGTAKLVDLEAHEATTIGRMIGTISYMSPEQTRCATVDPRSDLFAAGVILFELLTLRHLWHRDAADIPVAFGARPPSGPNALPSLVVRISEGRRIPPSELRPQVAPALDGVVARALQVQAQERFASAREMRAALIPLLGLEPQQHIVPPRVPSFARGTGPRERSTRPVGGWEGPAWRALFQVPLAPAERAQAGMFTRLMNRRSIGSLVEALLADRRFEHFDAERGPDERVVLSGAFAFGADELVSLRIEIDPSTLVASISRTIAPSAQSTLDRLNGIQALHPVGIQRLWELQTDGAQRSRAEDDWRVFKRVGGLSIDISGSVATVSGMNFGAISVEEVAMICQSFFATGQRVVRLAEEAFATEIFA